MKKFRDNFDEAFAPISRLVAHGLAVGLGFVAVATITMLPIITMKLLAFFGFAEESEAFHRLESVILYGDLLLFLVILVAGILIFIKEEAKRLWDRFFGGK